MPRGGGSSISAEKRGRWGFPEIVSRLFLSYSLFFVYLHVKSCRLLDGVYHDPEKFLLRPGTPARQVAIGDKYHHLGLGHSAVLFQNQPSVMW